VKLDDKVCYCFHVTKRKILNFIRITRPRRASQLSECGGAGTGCGWCRPFLLHYFEQMVLKGVEEPDDQITPEEYQRLRDHYLQTGQRLTTPPCEGAESETGAPDGSPTLLFPQVTDQRTPPPNDEAGSVCHHRG
jgi:bacterioferritin-associated ferredoxin